MRSTNGATARWEGSFTVDPPTARGEVTIEGFPIAPLMPYLARATSATIVDGLLNARLRYEAAPPDRPAVLRASIPIATLERLRILDGRDLLIESPRLTLTDADLDLVARTANIRSLRLLNSTLHLVRAEDGRPAILRLFPWADREGLAALEEMHGRDDDQGADLTEFPVERVAAAVNAIVRGATGEWTIDLKSLALHDQVVSYIDRSPRRVVETTLRRARLDAGPIRSAQELAAPFFLEGVLGTNGALRLEGMLRPLSAKVEVQVDADEIDLTPFAPYLPPQFLQDLPPTELTDGVARVAGRS